MKKNKNDVVDIDVVGDVVVIDVVVIDVVVINVVVIDVVVIDVFVVYDVDVVFQLMSFGFNLRLNQCRGAESEMLWSSQTAAFSR
jgi:hypothetical protein